MIGSSTIGGAAIAINSGTRQSTDIIALTVPELKIMFLVMISIITIAILLSWLATR